MVDTKVIAGKSTTVTSNGTGKDEFIPKLDWVVVTEPVLTGQECERLIACKDLWKRHQGTVHRVTQGGARSEFIEKSAQREATLYSPQTPIPWLFKRISQAVNNINEQVWKFQLADYAERPNLMRYDEAAKSPSGVNGHYDWHMDVGTHPVMAKRKISFSLILNDDYGGKGMEFKIGRQGTPEKPPRGALIAFPSYILHRVHPVTSGTRWALVGWVHGPSFS